MTRQRLTRSEKLAMIEAQDGKCACGCGGEITMENCDGEHALNDLFRMRASR